MAEKKTWKKKIGIGILVWILLNVGAIAVFLFFSFYGSEKKLHILEKQIMETAGQNKKITGSYDESLAVVCDNGTFVGKEQNGVRSYRGIPYAESPTGSLRWKPPVDAGKNAGVYEAYYYGKSNIQTPAASERSSLYIQGEDCLTLNVWTSGTDSTENAAPKPVMVFIHGGAYGWGGTADPIYDGQNFVEAHNDIVLVTINYRIGLMGFVDFSEVPGGEEFRYSGNLGLLDQISALRWVNRNIAAFGGDPSCVTIFGESAGAGSVSFLPLIDEAKGLFQRVIAQSGSVAFSFSREEGQSLTEKLLEETGAKTMDDLMALTEAELMKVNKKLNDYNNFPERDGIVLPDDLFAEYASGKAADIDMMTGTNADEARYWIDEVGGIAPYVLAAPLMYGSTLERIDEEDRPYADAFIELQGGDDTWSETEFFNEMFFRAPAIKQAELHAESGGKHYMYYWTKPSDIEYYGACHAVELAYVFNNTEDTIYIGKPADKALASVVQEMWVNFAKTGDSSTSEYKWERYDETDRKTMILGDEIHMEEDPMSQQRTLTEPLLKYRFNGYFNVFEYSVMYLRKRVRRAALVLLGVNAVVLVVRWILKRRKG